MGTPFLGEIRVFSFNFAPKGWAMCNGQILSIQQNSALFALLGTVYGGNGIQTFALPNLQGQAPVHMGNGYVIGQTSGEVAHTVTMAEMGAHTHLAQGTSTNTGLGSNPTGTVLAGATNVFTSAANLVSLSSASLAGVGGGQPHENRQPFLTLNFCIALQGIFPSRN